MSITQAELKLFRSAFVSDAGSNGGLMSSSEIVSGVSSNLFPNASSVDRANGATQYRKMFFKVANADNDALLNARIWQDSNTVGQDRVVFSPGSQRDTQSSLSGSETKYGMGVLAQGVLAGGQTLLVTVEDGAVPIFRNAGLIRISNKADPFSAGDEVWVYLDQAPVVVGNQVTLHIETPLQVGFLSGAKVSSVFEAGTVKATVVNPSASSVSGSLSPSWAERLLPTGLGTIEQNWTLTFTSPTAFDIVGDTVGAVGSGNVSAGAGPVNPNGNMYFHILPTLFVGSFLAGETITFTTHPAAVPVWVRRVVPAGCTAESNNNFGIYIDGEAA